MSFGKKTPMINVCKQNEKNDQTFDKFNEGGKIIFNFPKIYLALGIFYLVKEEIQSGKI